MVSGRVRLDYCSAYNGGTPLALTVAERDALRNYGIVTLDDRELLKFDNS